MQGFGAVDELVQDANHADGGKLDDLEAQIAFYGIGAPYQGDDDPALPKIVQGETAGRTVGRPLARWLVFDHAAEAVAAFPASLFVSRAGGLGLRKSIE